ncbi:uncharacterized protein METZ01_LOCUS105740 [marine metagenome]|uniref:Uncharacterized protein n=1 Tax=marine metagenome TaxID=408172 RepID=A0A381WK44_9ZZZZ
MRMMFLKKERKLLYHFDTVLLGPLIRLPLYSWCRPTENGESNYMNAVIVR